MLSELYIKNYLFVREERIHFHKGMTVITGETGAGKSVLVGSVALIFADRGDPEALDKSLPIYLEASFNALDNPDLIRFLEAEGYFGIEDLVLAREISVAGKSQYFLCGRKISASLIKELKPLIIDFHHQRDQQKLLNPVYQLDLLDNYAGLDQEREAFGISYHKLRHKLKQLEDLRATRDKNLQLKELYQYQFDELEQARLQQDEDIHLQQEFELLSHAREIIEAASTASLLLTEGEASIYDQLRSINSSLHHYSGLNSRLEGILQNITESMALLQDCSSDLIDLSETMADNPGRLESIQNRLDEINALVFKHRVNSIAELMELFAQRQLQLDAMENNELLIAELEASTDTDFRALVGAADQLSAKRRIAATKLAKELVREIRQLSIPQAQLEIEIDKKAIDEKSILKYLSELDESGADNLSLLFSANPGFSPKALSTVASGGELSRVLLAIKKVLAVRIPPKLVILDEIDSGIGGKTATQVARFIHELASGHRVMCITHLAQIAAVADSHIAITKVSAHDQTTIKIKALSEDERLAEIARMLSGSTSELSLLHASELINKEKKDLM
ncbi:MAG TPA: DNA repair protein RecN [Candidatus Cloacimonadota bacterium]|nr:DNA repair protein RecN [Candidatus Cloacimonadota bacterium]